MLTLVLDRRDVTLGPKVKTWSGTCPTAMHRAVFPGAAATAAERAAFGAG